jgi:hypothetical protein
MPFDTIYFDLTEEHVKLIRRFYIRWDGAYEGAPAVDSKRPFGNSDWEEDICEILGIEPIEHDDMEDEIIYPKGTRERVTALFHELREALQVVCASGSFEPGRYETEKYHETGWKRSDDDKLTLIVAD